MVANFSKEELTIPKAMSFGVTQEVSESLLVTLDEWKQAEPNFIAKKRRGNGNLKFQRYVDEKLAHLSSEDREVIRPVLGKYHIFSMTRKATILSAPI
jgi:hypothetical protein